MSSAKGPSHLNQLPNVNRTWEEIISSSGAAPMAVASPGQEEETPATSSTSSQMKANNHAVHDVQNVPITLSSATEHNETAPEEEEASTSRPMTGKRPVKRSSTAREYESDYSSLSAMSEDDEEYQASDRQRPRKVSAIRTPLIKGEAGDKTIFNSRPADVEKLFANRESGTEEQSSYDLMKTEIPKPLMEAKVAMAGRHLYVCYQKSSDKFEVRIYTERCRYKFVGGTFYSLTEAVRSRDNALREAGRDPPNEQPPEESDSFIEQVKEDLGFFNDGASNYSSKNSRRTNYEKKYAKMLPKYISVKSDRNIFRVVLGISGKRVNVGNYKYLSEAIAGRDEKLMELGRSIPDTVDENFNLVKFPASRKTPDPKIYNNTKPQDVSSIEEATPVRRSGRKRMPKRPPIEDSFDGEDEPAQTASSMPAWMPTAMNPQLESTIRQAWWSNPESLAFSEDPTHPGYWKHKSEDEAKEFLDKVSTEVLEDAKKHPILQSLINNYSVRTKFV